MRAITRLLVFALVILPTESLVPFEASGAASSVAPDITVIRNAELVTMTDRGILHGMALVIEGKQIRDILPDSSLHVPPGATEIDAAGGFIAPGYVDAHIHYRHPDELLNYLAHGVTTVVSLGQPAHQSRALLEPRDAIRRGDAPGPQVYTTAGIIPNDVAPATPAEARAYVRSLAAGGYDLVKVYNDTSRNIFDAVVDEAHKVGLSVFGHIPRGFPAAYSLSHGLDVVAHAEEFYFTYYEGARDRDLEQFAPTNLPDLGKTDALIAMLLQSKAAVIPALGGGFAHMVVYDDDEIVFADPELRYLHPRLTAMWHTQSILERSSLDKRMLRERIKYAFCHEMVRRMFDAGVPIVSGTDASMPNQPPGKSLHRELREFVKTGLTSEQALATTTREAGSFIRAFVDKKARIGLIQEGYEADLVLVHENPLENIRHAADIEGVMTDGRWYSAATIKDMRESRAARYTALRALGEDLARAIKAKATRGDIAALLDRHRLTDRDAAEFAAFVIEEQAHLAFAADDSAEVLRILMLNSELFPHIANVWDTLGEVYLYLEQPEKALMCYQRALDEDPEFDHAKQQIGQIRQRQRKSK